MDTKQALQNVQLFQAIVPKAFAVYGTCLGFQRDGDIILHDLDTDMGIMAHDFNYNILEDLQRAGFKITKIFGMPSCGMEIAFKKDGIKTDLMLFYKHDKLLFNCLWDNGGENGLSDMIVHSYDPALLKSFETTKGVRHLSRDYIESVYGLEWRTPTSPWNWRTDHKCINKYLKQLILKKYGQ